MSAANLPEMMSSVDSTSHHKPAMQHDMSAAMRACADACDACRRQCLITVAHGVESGGVLAGAPHVQLLLDCASVCATTVDFLARGSARHAALCRLCAEICTACEESCRSMPQGSTVARCGELCRACAEACLRAAAA